MAEDDEKACSFRCVMGSECHLYNFFTSIPEFDGMYCRSCLVQGCEQCAEVGDFCAKCGIGYTLTKAGKCKGQLRMPWVVGSIVMVGLILFVLAWYVDLWCRPVSNREGVQEGLDFRKRLKLQRYTREAQGPVEGEDEQMTRVRVHGPVPAAISHNELWPLTTNTLRTPAAGPGTLLFFNFQVAVMAWALLLAFCWLTMALRTDPDLLVLGTRVVETPWQFCSVIAWGADTQGRLMWAKVNFTILAYLGTFLLSLLHAGRQQKLLADLDHTTTMSHFAALCSNLPVESGKELSEEKLREFFESNTGQEVVGVSVCWDFEDRAEAVAKAVEEDIARVEQRFKEMTHGVSGVPVMQQSLDAGQSQERRQSGSKWSCFNSVDKVLLDALGVEDGAAATTDAPIVTDAERGGEQNDRHQRVQALLHGLQTSGSAFVVFRTEAARNQALQHWERLKPSINGCFPKLELSEAQPETVWWDKFTVERKRYVVRILIGIAVILGALLLWACIFYLPYAVYVSSFSYAVGSDPNWIVQQLFSLVVTAGNQIMYFLCQAISERVGHRFRGSREALYVILYVSACFINVLLDLSISGYVSYKMMVAQGAHGSGNQRLQDLGTFKEIFESFPMQKTFGQELWLYAFPACFLYPFLVEPLLLVCLPYHLATLITRSRPELRGSKAEKVLGSMAPMDLSRYGDVLLNCFLASAIFFFPGGFFLRTFLALVGCHLWIFIYDHYRVLRAVPEFYYSDDVVDKTANQIMAIPCAVIAGCVVFKSNCQPGYHCVADERLFPLSFLAVFAHILLHWTVLAWIQRKRHRDDHKRDDGTTYETAAANCPHTWFSSNPVYCLRSRYIYKDEVPVNFYMSGKEHLLVPQVTSSKESEKFAGDSSGFTWSMSRLLTPKSYKA